MNILKWYFQPRWLPPKTSSVSSTSFETSGFLSSCGQRQFIHSKWL